MCNINFKNKFSNAKHAISSGNYELAAKIYRNAISNNSELSRFYKANISFLKKKSFRYTSPVIINICSIPERINSLYDTIKSIEFQADKINIYLDRYKNIPTFLKNIDIDTSIILSSQCYDLRDAGKFIFLDQYTDAYYFTIDDDIIYPKNYVEVMINKIEEYNRYAVIGVHGYILPKYPKKFFCKKRIVFHYARRVVDDILVNGLGTGTIAFHSSILKDLHISYFKKLGMTDIYLSLYCKEHFIPMVTISRNDLWLKTVHKHDISLFNEFVDNDFIQSKIIIEQSPWGLCSINKCFHKLIDESGRHASYELYKLFKQSISTYNKYGEAYA